MGYRLRGEEMMALCFIMRDYHQSTEHLRDLNKPTAGWMEVKRGPQDI